MDEKQFYERLLAENKKLNEQIASLKKAITQLSKQIILVDKKASRVQSETRNNKGNIASVKTDIITIKQRMGG